MNNTISKLVLDITDELNQYAEDRKRLSENSNDFFSGEAEAFRQAIDIVARIATKE